MKIAITGENGFLGYHLTRYYSNRATIVSLGRNFQEKLYLTKDCDYIIHAAGVNRATTDKAVYFGNINLAMELVETLENLDIAVNLKFASSIQENNDTAYGRSKVIAKNILNDYCSMNGTVLQSYTLPNLFGTHGKPNYNSFVNTFAYNIVNDIECYYNDNEVRLCWVYDAINVIDDQKANYELYKTTVKEVYLLLLGIHNKSIDASISSFAVKLEEILNYYKK